MIFFLLICIYECLAYPDVEVREVTPDWEFVVIACDGIWDVLTNEVSLWQCLSFQSMSSLKGVTCYYHYPIPIISNETSTHYKLICVILKEKCTLVWKNVKFAICCSYVELLEHKKSYQWLRNRYVYNTVHIIIMWWWICKLVTAGFDIGSVWGNYYVTSPATEDRRGSTVSTPMVLSV
jgi:hypothetical protein